MTGPASTDRDEAGFSLIEALIALAIIAAITGALVATIAADAHARFAVRQRREALLLAQSALDRARGGDPVDSGQFQALTWRLDRTPYEQDTVPFATTRLEQATVTVSDAGGHSLVRLTTVRIVS